jgi:adenosylcobyric acid synthase
VTPGQRLPGNANLILLAGSKSTRGDLEDLQRNGWDEDIHAAVATGSHVLGICGGYQMLGRQVADPEGIEGTPGVTRGLGLLDIETTITGQKKLSPAIGHAVAGRAPITGFEMHMGVTRGPDTDLPLLHFADGRPDGATSHDGRVCGTYVHGLFAADAFRHSFLKRIDERHSATFAWNKHLDEALDLLADHMQSYLTTDHILGIARGS